VRPNSSAAAKAEWLCWRNVIKSLCLIEIIYSCLTQTGGKTSEMGVCFLGMGVG
jgi:hypothetical protein